MNAEAASLTFKEEDGEAEVYSGLILLGVIIPFEDRYIFITKTFWLYDDWELKLIAKKLANMTHERIV